MTAFVDCSVPSLPVAWTRQRPSPTSVAAYYQPFTIDYVTEFNQLLNRWKSETAILSTTREMMELESFHRMVNMGDRIVPLIVEELKTQPGFIFLALHLITGENPVPPQARGRVPEIINAWLSWASRNRRYAD
jgi:hypothetical protein